MSASWELQKAIFATLDAALTVGVYSLGNVPDGLTGLFVVVGNSTMLANDTSETLGFEATITIDTWDNDPLSRGFNKLKPLMGEVYTALNRATFVIAGYTLVDIQAEYEQPFLDPDGVTTHGVQRFRAIISTN